MIVIDASVAVKWLVPETGSAIATAYLKSGDVLVAPALIRTEVLGGVLRHFRKGDISETVARSACGAWDQMLSQGAIGLLSVEKVLPRAVEISITARHAIADCIYVAAAEEFAAELVTADQTLHDRCHKIYESITMLPLAA